LLNAIDFSTEYAIAIGLVTGMLPHRRRLINARIGRGIPPARFGCAHRDLAKAVDGELVYWLGPSLFERCTVRKQS